MKKLFILVASVFLVSVQPALSAELTILTENLPPLNYVEDGVLVGPSVDTVKEIQRRVGSQEEQPGRCQESKPPWHPSRRYQRALAQESRIYQS